MLINHHPLLPPLLPSPRKITPTSNSFSACISCLLLSLCFDCACNLSSCGTGYGLKCQMPFCSLGIKLARLCCFKSEREGEREGEERERESTGLPTAVNVGEYLDCRFNRSWDPFVNHLMDLNTITVCFWLSTFHSFLYQVNLQCLWKVYKM